MLTIIVFVTARINSFKVIFTEVKPKIYHVIKGKYSCFSYVLAMYFKITFTVFVRISWL